MTGIIYRLLLLCWAVCLWTIEVRTLDPDEKAYKYSKRAIMVHQYKLFVDQLALKIFDVMTCVGFKIFDVI